MATKEIKRVQHLLTHAQQLAGSSKVVDERIKSLSSRLETLKQLHGGSAAEAAAEPTAAPDEEVPAAEDAQEEVAAAEETTAADEPAAEEESA